MTFRHFLFLIKDVSFCFEKKIRASKIKTTAFQPGPVLSPSGDGSPLETASQQLFVESSLTSRVNNYNDTQASN